jgi:hypothetical protein
VRALFAAALLVSRGVRGADIAVRTELRGRGHSPGGACEGGACTRKLTTADGHCDVQATRHRAISSAHPKLRFQPLPLRHHRSSPAAPAYRLVEQTLNVFTPRRVRALPRRLARAVVHIRTLLRANQPKGRDAEPRGYSGYTPCQPSRQRSHQSGCLPAAFPTRAS